MRGDGSPIESQLEELQNQAARAIVAVSDIPRLAESRQSDLNRQLRGIQFGARDVLHEVKALRDTLPVKRIDIDRTIAKLASKAESYEAYVEKYGSKGLHSVFEVGVNQLVAERLRETIEALEHTRNIEANQPWVETENGRSKSLSPEEWLASFVEHYQQTVFDYVNRLNSRSTSESSRIEESVRAQAASEMLQFYGAAPRRAYMDGLIVWKTDDES